MPRPKVPRVVTRKTVRRVATIEEAHEAAVEVRDGPLFKKGDWDRIEISFRPQAAVKQAHRGAFNIDMVVDGFTPPGTT